MPPAVDGHRRRCPAFTPVTPPRNKGLRYPADPPTVEEIVAVMRIAGDGLHGRRLRGLIVVLWRAGLRIHEALALRESDLDRRRGSLLVRQKAVAVGTSGPVEHLEPLRTARLALPLAPCFASSAAPRAGARGLPPPRAPSCGEPRRPPACVDGSRPISCVTRTRSRWPTRACR